MASKYYFETRDERIERMFRDNPGRPIQLCTAVVDGIWDKKRKLIDSHIPERFKDASIEDLGYLSRGILDAVQAMFEQPDKNEQVGVIFCGPAGSGKTHAAYAVMNMLKEKNPEMIALMTTYSQAFSAVKSEFANGSFEEMGSMWDRLNNESGMYDGLLMLDDISSQKLTDFEVDKLMMFLERRLNSYMPFLMTTNVKPDDFKTVFGERLGSRLFGYATIIEFEEIDKRLEEKE
ncbi:MAG: AAA family ATPase [Candidatus Colwellbacteria bacterium]|nr:AAA family ATPase [Candidatus Colwellbacteria bacterium]